MAIAANRAREHHLDRIFNQLIYNNNHIQVLTDEIQALNHLIEHPRTSPIERDNAVARRNNMVDLREIIFQENDRINAELDAEDYLTERDPNTNLARPTNVIPSIEGQEN